MRSIFRLAMTAALSTMASSAFAETNTLEKQSDHYLISPSAAPAASAQPAAAYGSVTVNVSGKIGDPLATGVVVECVAIMYQMIGVNCGPSTTCYVEMTNSARTQATVSGTTFGCAPKITYYWGNPRPGTAPGLYLTVNAYKPAEPLVVGVTPVRSSENRLIAYVTAYPTTGTNLTFNTIVAF